MSRRKRVYRKEKKVDAKYGSHLVVKLTNKIMRDGKKTIAEKIVYDAIETVNKDSKSIDPLDLLNRAIENAKPRVEVKSRRVGGATYQVPREVDINRQETLAIRWLVNFARSKKGKPMFKALSEEIKDAAYNQGNAIRKRDEMHRMAKANRAFAHFRW